MGARRKVVILGAGFAGLAAARALAHSDADVLLVDRNNFHTFWPLLYQVATAGLEAEEVAYPVRGIFRGVPNVRFVLGEVGAIDRAAKTVMLATDHHTHALPYDQLVVAVGSAPNIFGREDVAAHAFRYSGLYSAVALRNHILKLYERAAWTNDTAYLDALTTMVVVGGGPTGLETAGAFIELYNNVLRKEYPHLGDRRARVILVEKLPHVLAPYPPRLRKAAQRQLAAMGVEVRLGVGVDVVAADHVRLEDGTVIPTMTLVWAAGVVANPTVEALGVALGQGGRVPVRASLQLVDDDDVYAVGDVAALEGPDGAPYPQLAPVAMQQGTHAAQNVLRRMRGEPHTAFHYNDRGSMATIGRSRAVAWLYNRVPLSGFVAWATWLFVHLLALVGFRNRLNVLINWMFNYITYDRAARAILDAAPSEVGARTSPIPAEPAHDHPMGLAD